MKYPNIIIHNSKSFRKHNNLFISSGLNPKVIYKDQEGNLYLAKTEKERSYKSIFEHSLKSLNQINITHRKHMISLKDQAVATQHISSIVAKTIFKSLHVPESKILRLKNGTPIILSKLISSQLNFNEFLSNSNYIHSRKPHLKTPLFWKKNHLPCRSSLIISNRQAEILGEIYYIGLLLSHWDIINNIDLSNSGSVKKNGKLYPCIVDWGNCLGVGFGGLCQDSTAFKNPEFKSSNDCTDPITGFSGCTPFDDIVYPKLPRQVIKDLFDLCAKNTTSKAMFHGFKKAHKDACDNIHLVNSISYDLDASFIASLNQELFIGIKDRKPDLINILQGRLNSLANIISKLEQGIPLEDIAKNQFTKITKRQSFAGFDHKL